MGLVDGPNTYGFCGGDPVNRSDPMGKNWVWNGTDWIPANQWNKNLAFDPAVVKPNFPGNSIGQFYPHQPVSEAVGYRTGSTFDDAEDYLYYDGEVYVVTEGLCSLPGGGYDFTNFSDENGNIAFGTGHLRTATEDELYEFYQELLSEDLGMGNSREGAGHLIASEFFGADSGALAADMAKFHMLVRRGEVKQYAGPLAIKGLIAGGAYGLSKVIPGVKQLLGKISKAKYEANLARLRTARLARRSAASIGPHRGFLDSVSNANITEASIIHEMRKSAEGRARAKIIRHGNAQLEIVDEVPEHWSATQAGEQPFGTRRVIVARPRVANAQDAAGVTGHETQHFIQGLTPKTYTKKKELEGWLIQQRIDPGFYPGRTSEELFQLIRSNPRYMSLPDE